MSDSKIQCISLRGRSLLTISMPDYREFSCKTVIPSTVPLKKRIAFQTNQVLHFETEVFTKGREEKRRGAENVMR